ncbi:NlpC/P60 family protein [Parasphingopyxis marina]|uniref:Peptidoglycan endopeptidase n=1 Tax=Parasphingopyxis marina TaxID=2761622 RepID=A0A842HYS5_9SPHN|nr:peptidoglycan endopeptidase [Parasphingopyxis marina]MBC2778306.1 peptidoglycan endopeptidase [Parasphingopyxis marina]
MDSDIIVGAARGCIGAPFRFQGRDPATGLDCVGLAAHAYRAAGASPVLPQGYALRGQRLPDVSTWIEASGLRRIDAPSVGAGGLLLLDPGARQLHLAIHSGAGFIHADLGLRRTVETPGAPRWPVLAAWRWSD